METNPDLGTQHRKSVETPTVRLTLNFGIDPQKAGQEMLLQAVPRSCGNPWESFPSCLAKDGSSSFQLMLESFCLKLESPAVFCGKGEEHPLEKWKSQSVASAPSAGTAKPLLSLAIPFLFLNTSESDSQVDAWGLENPWKSHARDPQHPWRCRGGALPAAPPPLLSSSSAGEGGEGTENSAGDKGTVLTGPHLAPNS